VYSVYLKDVLKCIEGGYLQSNSGSRASIEQLGIGDKMIFYSPRGFDNPARSPMIRKFTSIGTILNENIYQIEINSVMKPFRRDMEFERVKSLDVFRVLKDLDFIENRKKWWETFERRQLFEISEKDFEVIAGAMRKKREQFRMEKIMKREFKEEGLVERPGIVAEPGGTGQQRGIV
jgi:hypothetical protein